MRFINLDLFKPSEEWKEKAKKATDELLSKTTQQERVDYIKSHSRVWRDLRVELTEKFGDRCWFTDAEELIAPLDIEHFRPKLKALDEDKTENDGYWWLSFEIQNLRLAGQVPNRNYKRCFFPLLPGCTRASYDNPQIKEELPVFLDPINPADVALVSYNEAGEMCPSEFALTDIEKRRVLITNELLGLSSHLPLLEARKQVWANCRELIDKIKILKREQSRFGPTPRSSAEVRIFMVQLVSMTLPEHPLSSVARSCIRVSGESWARTLIGL